MNVDVAEMGEIEDYRERMNMDVTEMGEKHKTTRMG